MFEAGLYSEMTFSAIARLSQYPLSSTHARPYKTITMNQLVNNALPHSQLTVKHQWMGLAVWLALVFAVAAIGAVASMSAATFYAQMLRPSWAPPGWLFGPVWSLLYAMMGLSAFLVWRVAGFAPARTALLLFMVQLGVNALWSWLFFEWHLGMWAFVDVLLLWCLIVACIAAFWRTSRWAAALLVPYLLWVSFASALTFSVWQLNPALL